VLSEHERRQLDDIELGLLSTDPALSAAFERAAGRPRRRLAWARSTVAAGILLVATGLVVGFDPAFMDGLVLVLAGTWWWAWLRAPGQDGPRGVHTGARDDLGGGGRG
jgi:Protein of unknown function (DUF3040)